jgi:hypothetical protein
VNQPALQGAHPADRTERYILGGEIAHQLLGGEIAHQLLGGEISHQLLGGEISHQLLGGEISHQRSFELALTPLGRSATRSPARRLPAAHLREGYPL